MKLRILLYIAVMFIACNAITAKNRSNKIVTLDNYYNHEVNKEGNVWHYTWEDTSMGGFSALGELFKKAGGTLKTLSQKPTEQTLKDSKVYIIVDPDKEKESPAPKYMDEEAANTIMEWVKKGGRLVIFTNDKGNCDLQKINILSEKAGIHFNENSISNERPYSGGERFYDDCAFTKFTKHPIFKGVTKILLKGVCTIKCTKPARGILMADDGSAVMAVSKVEKGLVIAITDPWLYNEYLDDSHLPDDFTNDIAAENLSKWLLD